MLEDCGESRLHLYPGLAYGFIEFAHLDGVSKLVEKSQESQDQEKYYLMQELANKRMFMFYSRLERE